MLKYRRLCILAASASWLGAAALGCRTTEAQNCADIAPVAGEVTECALDDWPDRRFNMMVPEGEGPHPLLIAFHGGGGSKSGALRTTCPEGQRDDADCLDAMALAENYVVVAPDGTDGGLNLRTWNAGGGVDQYRCTSGDACKNDVDDLKYFDDLMAAVKRAADVDPTRVYLTGISNGGAISYRIACERADQVAAIAPVGGGNQAIVAPGCTPTRAVPLLHIHGTADPAWKYAGGTPDTAITGQKDLEHVGIEDTVIGGGDFTSWVELAGCSGEPEVIPLDDAADDGTTTEVLIWSDCDQDAEVRLVRIDGGGHTWPQGWPYLNEATVGPVAQDFSANAMLLAFFSAHRAPE